MNKELAYLKEQWKGFVLSFKSLDRRIFFAVLASLLFFIAAFLLYLGFIKLAYASAASLSGLDLASSSGEAIANNAEQLKSFVISSAVYLSLLVLLIAAAYIISSLAVWAIITGKSLRKIKLKFAGKFVLMEFIWLAAWAFLIFIVASSIREESAMKWLAFIALAYSHLTALLCMSYFKKPEIRRAVKMAFSAGFGKLSHFIVPYAFALALFLALNFILTNAASQSRYFTFAATLAILFYASWLKIYINSFAKKLV